MSRAFENDPRLKHMDPGRLSALQSLAKELEAAPGDQKMAAFLSAGQKARQGTRILFRRRTGAADPDPDGRHVRRGTEKSRSRPKACRTDTEKQTRCITKRGAAETGCIILFRSIPLSVSFYKYPV